MGVQKLEKWKTVGCRLEIEEARLTAFDNENCENKVLPSQINGRTGTTLKNSFWVKAFLGGTRWLRKGTGIYYGC